MTRRYSTFFAMIGTSSVLMFVMMYLNTWAVDHVRFSETRLYMTGIMAATMTVVMLGFMWSMYDDIRVKVGIVVGAAALFGVSLLLVRSQANVSDSAYMRGMIPHHSIAILTSERTDFEDRRVRELARGIVEAQRREIKEMSWLLNDIRDNGPVTTESEMGRRPVPSFDAAPRTAAR